MDQASAWLVASCARNPAVPKTSPSWRLSEDQSQIVVPPRDGSAPQFEPHSEPVHIAPRPSSPALCQSNAKGYLLPDFYSGCATGIPGRFSEGLLLRRVQLERDGLIRIEATISDRRAKELHLTKAGEKRLQVAHERWSEAQSRFETTFGPRRAAELRTMLRAAVASEFAPVDHGSSEFADR